MKCPVCHILLCRIERGGVPISVCPECWGALVEYDRFRSMRKMQAGAAAAQGTQREPAEPRGTDHVEPLRCPRCLAKMAKVKQGTQAAPFHLDVCVPCGMIWFDKGELEVAEAALGRPGAPQASADEDLALRKALAEFELMDSAERMRQFGEVVQGVAWALSSWI